MPSVARAAAVTSIADRAFLEALAAAAVRAMPQLSAADICSVVESFSGGCRCEWVQGRPSRGCMAGLDWAGLSDLAG